jgi:uncharacterized protein YjiS (DUF1127 family)
LFDITSSTDMTTIVTRRRLASAPVQLDAVLKAVAQGLLAAARNFDAAWGRRSRAAIVIRELRTMSDRELRDIGLDRSDIPRIAREAQHEA